MNCFLFTQNRNMTVWAGTLHKMLSLSVGDNVSSEASFVQTLSSDEARQNSYFKQEFGIKMLNVRNKTCLNECV